MRKFILIFLFVSFVLSTEIGRYQLETTTYISKKGSVYIVETVLDTKTGKIVKRAIKKATSYKLPYKNSRGKLITEE